MEAGYFEHDADIGIIGRGTTVEEAFVSAAHAMFAIQAGLDAVQSRERIELDFEEDDAELALVRWLNALLAASNERGMALREFGLARAGARWRGWALGERWRDGLVRGTEVKGATLTMLSVSRETQGWEARCVVDV
ncbi:MAG: archease [Betaproteobacteria bacterium RBG_16_64_18]|nr:MAG: archease [Betaproteobacteria bacterium RBG_16_64_18]OGA40387.1 MAG: archease [Betaproteobacteria bacterium RIFCSPLOWO2_12_FULL_65_110]